MSLLAPAALALFSLAIPLVVLYMLRSRRRRLEVPSIRMWEDEEQFVSAALPWQRLRITAALILQLLALAAFTFLLARPFFREATLLGPHTVLIVDTSGSMAMAGRMEAAVARATELVVDASDQQLVSIVEAGPRARVLAAFSRDPEALTDALDGLEAGGGVEDLTGALRLARGLATPDRPTSFIFLGDGGVEGALEEPVPNARHLVLDDVANNVAITAFGTGVPGEGVTRLFLEVSSFSNRTEEVAANLLVDGLSVGRVAMTLEPADRQQEIVPVDAGPGQVVTIELADWEDGNPLDDQSSVVLSGGSELTFAVLGEGSIFLDALLASLDGIEPAAGAPPDVAIFDGGDASLVDRPAWLIAPDEPPEGVTFTGRIDNPIVSYQRPGEPILEGLDLSDLAIAEAQIIEVAGWLPILRAGDVPLILLGDVEGRRVVYFTFDLVRSNLPVQVSFPILGARLIDWLGGNRSASAATSPAGTPLPLSPPAGTTPYVAAPGEDARAVGDGVLQFTATNSPGIYTAEYRNDDGAVVSSTKAARQFVASESQGSSRVIGATASEATSTEEATLLREWAPFLLALLLAIILIEWWVAYGRPMPRRRSQSERAAAA